MNIVVTVDENWAVSGRNGLLVQIPADQRNLQRLTAGGIVVMGRKTFQSMPQAGLLYNADIIVLSRNASYSAKGAKTVHSGEELSAELAGGKGKEIYVCGGESVYGQLLVHCDTAYVTMVEKAYAASGYFEDLDKSEEWRLTEESEEQTYFDITYYFRKYERVNGK